MTRASKKKVVECENNASTGRKTRQNEPQKRLRRQKDVVDETRVRRSREQPNSNFINQAIISHFFRPLEVDTKLSRAANPNLSSKGKIALRKYKPKKSKAKQLEEIQKYNKKIPMFFNYINPEKAKEIENNNGKTQTKSTRFSRNNKDELSRDQRQLTEFYDILEQISELSLSNKSELLRNNDDGTVIQIDDSNFEECSIFEGGLNCINTDKKDKGEDSKTLEISKPKRINRSSINFDDDMDCESSLITSPQPVTLSYHLSNFSIEPNDSFVTISPKVAHLDMEVGKTPTKSRMASDVEVAENNSVHSRNSPSPNLDEESLSGDVTKAARSSSHIDVTYQSYYNNCIEKSQVNGSILSYYNVTNENLKEQEQQDNIYHKEKTNITEVIVEEMIIDQEKDECNNSVDNIEDDNSHSDNCEIVNENLHSNQGDSSHCYSWESEIIDCHKEFSENEAQNNEDISFMIHKKQLEKEDSIVQKTNLDESMFCSIQKEQLEKENFTKQKINVNENISPEESSEKEGHILQRTEDTNCTIDDQNPIDFHCCSQSENKCEFHRINDLLDNQDSICISESLNDPILKELNNTSEQDRLISTEYIHSSTRFLKDEVSPASSPPTLLSQTTLAMIPQSAWDTLPSLNVSILEFNDDLL